MICVCRYVHKDFAKEGTEIAVALRGKMMPAQVCNSLHGMLLASNDIYRCPTCHLWRPSITSPSKSDTAKTL